MKIWREIRNTQKTKQLVKESPVGVVEVFILFFSVKYTPQIIAIASSQSGMFVYSELMIDLERFWKISHLKSEFLFHRLV